MNKAIDCVFWAIHDGDGAIYTDSDNRAHIYGSRAAAREACSYLNAIRPSDTHRIGRLTDDKNRLLTGFKP